MTRYPPPDTPAFRQLARLGWIFEVGARVELSAPDETMFRSLCSSRVRSEAVDDAYRLVSIGLDMAPSVVLSVSATDQCDAFVLLALPARGLLIVQAEVEPDAPHGFVGLLVGQYDPAALPLPLDEKLVQWALDRHGIGSENWWPIKWTDSSVVRRGIAVDESGDVIVKSYADTDNGRASFLGEISALEAMAAASPVAVTARPLSINEPRLSLFLEAVGGQSLSHLLLGPSGVAATDALVALARTLGTLHTVGFDRGRTLPIMGLPPLATGDWNTHVGNFVSVVGASAPAELINELNSVFSDVNSEKELRMTHGDPCPDNVVIRPDGTATLLDLERTGRGNPYTELAAFRFGFPSCWQVSAVPESVVRACEATYFETRGITPDHGYRRLAAAAAALIVLPFGLVQARGRRSTLTLDETLSADAKWGSATSRQRLTYRARRFVSLTQELDMFPMLRRACDRLTTTLTAQPGADDMPSYRAFADHGG